MGMWREFLAYTLCKKISATYRCLMYPPVFSIRIRRFIGRMKSCRAAKSRELHKSMYGDELGSRRPQMH